MQGPQGLNQQFIDRNSAKKKRQTAGTEKAEGVKHLMTVQFMVWYLICQDCRFYTKAPLLN